VAFSRAAAARASTQPAPLSAPLTYLNRAFVDEVAVKEGWIDARGAMPRVFVRRRCACPGRWFAAARQCAAGALSISGRRRLRS